MRRAVLVLAAALALAGCQESDQDQVRAAVMEYVHAYADGDAETVCARLAPELRRAFKEGCEAGIEREAAKLSQSAREALNKQEVRSVSVSGDTARARLNSGGLGTLRRVGGRWLIENR
jgi:ketosteroid isomerase-like protein